MRIPHGDHHLHHQINQRYSYQDSYQQLVLMSHQEFVHHFLILYNIFGNAATPLLFFKIDSEYWSVIKTVIIYLGRFPDYPKTKLHDIPVDIDCLSHLNEL